MVEELARLLFNKSQKQQIDCACMLGWHISEKRREHIKNRKRTIEPTSILDSFTIKTPQKRKSIIG